MCRTAKKRCGPFGNFRRPIKLSAGFVRLQSRCFNNEHVSKCIFSWPTWGSPWIISNAHRITEPPFQTKFELLDKLRPQFIHPNTLKTESLLVKFYGKNEIPKAALENTLPVLLHSCPEDFSTILYFNVWFLRCFRHCSIEFKDFIRHFSDFENPRNWSLGNLCTDYR